MNRTSENIPSISYDINLGQSVNHINVDPVHIADLLHYSGFTEEQISETEIFISNESNKYVKNGDTHIIGGTYDRETGDITVLVADEIEASKHVHDMYYDKFYGSENFSEDFEASILNKQVSNCLSQSLFHEIQHKIDFVIYGEEKIQEAHTKQIEEKYGDLGKSS